MTNLDQIRNVTDAFKNKFIRQIQCLHSIGRTRKKPTFDSVTKKNALSSLNNGIAFILGIADKTDRHSDKLWKQTTHRCEQHGK